MKHILSNLNKAVFGSLLVIGLLSCLLFAGCKHWYKDMKGFLEYWTETVEVASVEYQSPNQQIDEAGLVCLPVTDSILVNAQLVNPEGYPLNAGLGKLHIGGIGDSLKSVQIDDAVVMSMAAITASSPTNIQLTIDPIPIWQANQMEHRNVEVLFSPTRSENGMAASQTKGVVLRYNTPPRSPVAVEVVDNGSSQYDFVFWGSNLPYSRKVDDRNDPSWQMTTGTSDRELDDYLFFAWPQGITDERNPDYIKSFAVQEDSTGWIDWPLSNPDLKVSGKTLLGADGIVYEIYRIPTVIGTVVEVCGQDVAGIRGNPLVSGRVPHKIILDAAGGSWDGVAAINQYRAEGTILTYSDLPAPTKNGSVLTGWSMSAEGIPVSFPYTVSSSITLTALWAAGTDSSGSTGDTPPGTSSLSPVEKALADIKGLTNAVSGKYPVQIRGSLNASHLKQIADALKTLPSHVFVELDLSATIGLSIIEPNTFENCTSLSTVVLPDSMTSIGQSAFFGCDGLHVVRLGAGITTIEPNALECNNLNEVIFADPTAEWEVDDPSAGPIDVSDPADNAINLGLMFAGNTWTKKQGP